MIWLLWLLALVSLGVPVGSLVLDRAFGVPAQSQWRYWGIPSLFAFLIALIGGLISRNAIAELILWGDRKSTRLNSSHSRASRMPSSA